MNETNPYPNGFALGYFSVSSNFINENPKLPYTVNSLMLSAQIIEGAGEEHAERWAEGALILFAPAEVVRALVKDGDTTPPVVKLPGRRSRYAFVLPAPSFAFAFRYSAAAETW